MAISLSARCQGAFLGHVIASNFDSSIHLASVLAEDLLENKTVQYSEVFSKYLTLYHKEKYELGTVIQTIYKISKRTRSSGSPSQNQFYYDQTAINAMVTAADRELHGVTAGCGPANRSFPLAFCPSISDHELFEITMKEASLTHQDPIAGQVAGIINLICRELVREKTWFDAIRLAFSIPNLHHDVQEAGSRYCRSSTLFPKTPAAYAPSALIAALYCFQDANNFDEAIQNAKKIEDQPHLVLIGILAGARWGIPEVKMSNLSKLPNIGGVRATANRLANLWIREHVSIRA